MTHGGRIKFQRPFLEIPKVEIKTSAGDGTFDLTVVNIDREHFDYRVRARVRGRGTLSMIEFEWEAA